VSLIGGRRVIRPTCAGIEPRPSLGLGLALYHSLGLSRPVENCPASGGRKVDHLWLVAPCGVEARRAGAEQCRRSALGGRGAAEVDAV
jgi:hypothetical protein